ncbi:MAG: hypothetical protein JST16_19195 [Bdellovibrionales bacterium]|nr:hypothetical protein [Bdellovibrionales bacterium]
MKKTLMNDSMKAGGYSQEEAYFHKDNHEKILALRKARKGKDAKSIEQNQDPASNPGDGAQVIPFPQKNKKAA